MVVTSQYKFVKLSNFKLTKERFPISRIDKSPGNKEHSNQEL